MSVFGYDTEADTTVRATTVPVTLNIRASGFDGEDTPIPPTPDLYAQLLQKIQEGGSGRGLGVRIKFEKENLDTDTMTGKLILGILATIAQEESNSLSQNQAWSRSKHLERGEIWTPPRYGYTSVGKNHRWEIVPNQAEVVRMAFYMAAMCHTYAEIRDEMNRMEKEEGSTKVWTKATVALLLRSENYVGDFLSNKDCKIVDSDRRERRVNTSCSIYRKNIFRARMGVCRNLCRQRCFCNTRQNYGMRSFLGTQIVFQILLEKCGNNKEHIAAS